ncbi:MAG TPA: class I SAM-dependent methyltransferase [Pirellulales bacterium]|jgi:SAM-dependent methyltransferase|nr:class I SAM-dependent methyltransferase [Pirellulales bacterium]
MGTFVVPADPPQWRLAEGITLGLWQYAHADHIAYDYDEYFAHNSLFDFDESVLARHFTQPGLLVDLGCGTGRLLVPFARRGFRGLAVDLSMPMLDVVGQKTRDESLPIDRLRADMTQLDCVRDAAADYAICMFSTLGMIRGRKNRRRVLRHVRRILKPGGKFVLHVHNRWYNLFDPQGRVWLAQNMFGAVVRRNQEPGDKFFDYRGIPNMFLHVFTRRELKADLLAAGFRIVEFIALDTERRYALRRPWMFGRLRANGWIVVCARD